MELRGISRGLRSREERVGGMDEGVEVKQADRQASRILKLRSSKLKNCGILVFYVATGAPPRGSRIKPHSGGEAWPWTAIR